MAPGGPCLRAARSGHHRACLHVRQARQPSAWLGRLPLRVAGALIALTGVAAVPAAAQTSSPCRDDGRDDQELPPADSPPICGASNCVFHPENAPIDRRGDLHLLHQDHTERGRRATSGWPYNEDAIAHDFDSLWDTGFLDNLWVEVIDEPFSNGVMGEHVIFHMEERSRVKAVDYAAARTQGRDSKIEDTLRDKGIAIRLDTFVDQATIRKVRASSTISTPRRATTTPTSSRR